MAERLGFEIFADDKSSDTLARSGAALRKLAVEVEAAQIKVAKATEASAAAVRKHGQDSIQAREAANKLAQAELQLEGATRKHAAAQTHAGEQMEKVTKKTGGLRAAMASAGSTMAGVFGAQVVTAGLNRFSQFASESVEAASALGESMNAVQKVFGSTSNEIIAWGEKSAASYGLSQRAFQEMATPLGSGLKNAGLSMQDTAKWTLDLTKRASDMASVFNTSVPDALEAIQAGLRGEADPLERYGVGLSAAAVQAEAMAETHKAAAGQLTNAELATARLNLIMKQTSSTAGDFTSTSNGLANAQRISAAEMENAKAKLGQDLLPIMAKVTSTTAQLVGSFASLPGPVQAGAIGLVAVGGAALLLLPKLVNAKKAAEEMGVSFDGFKGKAGGFAVAIGKVGGALAALQLVDQLLPSNSGVKGVDTTTRALLELTRTGKDTSGTLKELDGDLESLSEPGWAQSIEGALASVHLDRFNEIKDRVAAIDGALARLVSDGNAEQAGSVFDTLAAKAKAQGMSLDDLKKLLPQYQNALDAAALAAEKQASQTDSSTKALDEQKKAFDDATKKASDYSSKLLALRGDEAGWYASMDAATQALKDNGKTLDVHTEKGRANRAALDGMAQASLSYLASLKEQGAPAAQYNAVLDDSRSRLYRLGVQFGMSKSAAREFANQILGMPRESTTTARFDKAGAQKSAGNWVSFLRAVPSSVWTTAGFDTSRAKSEWRSWVSFLRSTPSSVNGTLNLTGHSRGGWVRRSVGGWVGGSGPSNVDSVPTMLAPDEFVVRAAAAKPNAPLLEAINSGSVRGHASGGWIAGGSVPRASMGVVEAHFHFPNYVGPLDSLEGALVQLKRSGHLDKVLATR